MSTPGSSPVYPAHAPAALSQSRVQLGPLSIPVENHRPSASDPSSQQHLVSLVLQSKKALQQGDHLCTQAHTASHVSSQAAIDVLALDAKVRWVVEVVVEQLKLAASVAKTIEEKRTFVAKQIHEWDTIRTKRTDALDEILEALGAQVVPPDFHETSIDTSLFGSQHPSDIERLSTERLSTELKSSPKSSISPGKASSSYIHSNGHTKTNSGSTNTNASVTFGRPSTSPVSPSATIRRNGSLRKDMTASVHNGKGVGKSRKSDRKRWKTLRDFVDDQAIEDALEMIETDRLALDKITGKTDEYPETLTRTIESIQASLPFPDLGQLGALQSTQNIIMAQEDRVNTMASVLENLASHYDGMAVALKDMEMGEVFEEEDWQVMNRDTEELSAIIAELEESANTVEDYRRQLVTSKINLSKDLDHLHSILDDLDELGEIMGEMIITQESVETEAMEELNALHHHLTTLQQLQEQYVAYRMAFNKLLLEIARRRQYREAAENIVRGMMRQLESMTEEEDRVRSHFNAEYGQHLPEDLCLCIANSPTTWEVVPAEGTTYEVLPSIDNDLIVEARERIGYGDGAESS